MKKKVIVVNMVAISENELITEFESAKQASRELGISYDSIRSACQDMGNCLIGNLAFVYESNVHGLRDGDIINKIKIQRLNRLIFGK